MTKKQKQMRMRIIISAVIFLLLLILVHTVLMELGVWVQAILFLAPYLLIGYDIIGKAARNIRHGQIFDENFLMLIATIAAFCVQEFSEAVAVMLFYQVGELFQSCAVDRSRRSIAAMMDIVPEFANLETDGELRQVDPEEVLPGSIIVIKPGERIPLDGVVTEGRSLIDTAALTGESVPRRVEAGSDVVSGCINGSGSLKVRVTKAFEDSTVTRILELVENAGNRKARVENFITRFARIYTPVVTACAAALAVIPSLILGGWSDWLQRACIFLVVSCPCALVISVPLGFFGGIGAASRMGVLVKGGNFLEALSKTDAVVFDKTGTLTKGDFTVTQIVPAVGIGEKELLELGAYGECYSNHPIAEAVRSAYGNSLSTERVTASEEIAGFGARVVFDGREILVGSERLLRGRGVDCSEIQVPGTIVYIAADGRFAGTLVISDRIKDGADEAIVQLRDAGIRRCVMLTGDHRSGALAVADRLRLDEVHAELLPDDKVRIVEELSAAEPSGRTLAFVGDGINDAPVLARADIGVAMGSMGSDAAVEAADIVVMDDDLRKLSRTVRLARKTMRIIKENIAFALTVKILVMLLGALGVANMWMAVFADVGVSILAILNSLRALRCHIIQ